MYYFVVCLETMASEEEVDCLTSFFSFLCIVLFQSMLFVS